MCYFQALAVPWQERFVGICQGVLNGSQQQRQRCAKFVADVGEERCFRAVQFRQRLSAVPLSFIGAGVGDHRCYLHRNQLDEAAVVLIQRTSRAYASYQESCRLFLTSLS
jgi:hypothetical protein